MPTAKNDQSPRANVIEAARHIKRLLETARKCGESSDQEEILLSSFIYSSAAEYFGHFILVQVELDLNFYLAKRLPQIGLNYRKHKRTNLEYLVSELGRYRFYNHEKIIELLKVIRDARNNLFHNLMVAPQKGISIENEFNKISSSTEKLIKLHISLANSPYEKVIWKEDDD